MRRIFVLIIMLNLIASPIFATNLNVNVNRVISQSFPEITIYLTVSSRETYFTDALTKDNFEVLEDNVKQNAHVSVRIAPIHSILCLDSSGSMNTQKMRALKDAAITFVDRLGQRDKVMLIDFDHRIKVLTRFTSDKALLKRKIRSLSGVGGTSIYDAVIQAIRHAKKVDGRVAIILFSDGQDENSRHSLHECLRIAEASHIPIYTIGLAESPQTQILSMANPNPQRRRPLQILAELAERSLGLAFVASSHLDLTELYAHISRLLKSQVTLKYTTTNPNRDGSERNVRIKLKYGEASGSDECSYRAPKETRTGYLIVGSGEERCFRSVPYEVNRRLYAPKEMQERGGFQLKNTEAQRWLKNRIVPNQKTKLLVGSYALYLKRPMKQLHGDIRIKPASTTIVDVEFGGLVVTTSNLNIYEEQVCAFDGSLPNKPADETCLFFYFDDVLYLPVGKYNLSLRKNGEILTKAEVAAGKTKILNIDN